MNEMEALRIDEELQKQKYTPSHHHTFNRMSDQAAIGMVDIEMLTPGGDPGINRLSAPECSGLKKTALSNSLIDLTDGKAILCNIIWRKIGYFHRSCIHLLKYVSSFIFEF